MSCGAADDAKKDKKDDKPAPDGSGTSGDCSTVETPSTSTHGGGHGSMLSFALAVPCGDENGSGEPTSTKLSAALSGNVLFVVNGGDNSLSVVDTDMGMVHGTIELKGVVYPHHISLSPDRSRLALAIPGMDLSAGHDSAHGTSGMKGTVMLLDATTGETKAARALDAMNHNAIFSPDGKEIWTSQMSMPGTVLVLDSSSLATQKSVAVGDMPAEVTFSEDGKLAFVANGMGNSVTVVDAATKDVVKTIPVGEEPVGAWTGNDGMMYVDNEKGQSISAIDVATLTVTRTYELGFMPGMAATAPSGELWVTDTSGKVVFFAVGSTTKTGELATGAGAHAIAFSGDGKNAFISNQTAGTLSVVDSAAHTLMTTVAVGKLPNGLVFRSK